MGYHDLSAPGGRRVSTQDRAVRGGEQDAQSEGLEGGEAAAVGGGQLEPSRLRAMQRRWIQRKANGGGGGAAASIPGGSGAPLGGGVQARMEKTLGADLSGVRVHTGGESAQAAESLGARAFTVGTDVHFGHGEFAPGSKEGDRLLAHELTHVVQGQKSGIQRKAAHEGENGGDEHGDHEAGGHEVSEPGDPAEKEADAMGDHAADQLHGGGAEHGAAGGEHGGERKVTPEKPKVGAAAPSVGRKIFRLPKPSSAAASPKAEQATKPIPPAVALRIQSISKKLDGAAADRGVAVTIKASAADVDQFVKDYPAETSVKELQAKLGAKRTEIETAFQTDMKAATAAIAKIDASSPAHWPQFDALVKNPATLNWFSHPLFPTTHDLIQAFVTAREAKSNEFSDNKKTALEKAKKEIKAAPDKNESRALVEAVFDGAKPYIQDRSPYHQTDVVQLQEAFVAKLGSIETAAQAEKEKQEKLAKEQQQKQAAAQPAAGAGAASSAHKPPSAAPSEAAAPPTAAPSAAAATATTGHAAPPAPKKADAAPAPTATPAAATAPAPTAAHSPATGNAAAATPDAHAAQTGAAATPAPAQAAGSDSTGTHPAKSNEQSPASTTHATTEPGADAAGEDARAKELELKKQVAKARIHQYAASLKGKTSIFSGALEIGNALITVATKIAGHIHGIEIPEEVLSIGKDGVQSFLKMEGLNVEVQAAVAEAEVESAESIGEIDGLFESAEHLRNSHLKTISRAHALFVVAQRCLADEVERHKGAQEPKAARPEPAVAEAPEAGDDKTKDKAAPGLAKKFSNAMAASDEREASDMGGYKQMVNEAAIIMDPLKALNAGFEIKTELKEMGQAKRELHEAEEELAKHLAAHGGTPLPGDKKKQEKK